MAEQPTSQSSAMSLMAPWTAPPGIATYIVIPCCLLCRRDIAIDSAVCSSTSDKLTTPLKQPPEPPVTSVHHRHLGPHSLHFLAPDAEAGDTSADPNIFECFGFMYWRGTDGVIVYNCAHTRCLAAVQKSTGDKAAFVVKRVFEQTRPILPLQAKYYRNNRNCDQKSILSAIGPSESAQLQVLLHEVLGVYRRQRYKSMREMERPLSHCGNTPTKIRARMVSIFGELHIEKIEGVFDSAGSDQVSLVGLFPFNRGGKYDNNRRDVIGNVNLRTGNIHEIESMQPFGFRVKGLQYALGSHGIAALRVVYHDGLFSPWLGHFGFTGRITYVTTLEGQDLRSLQTTSDGFKVTSITLCNPTRVRSENKIQLFWDHEKPFLDPDKVYRFHNCGSARTHMLYNAEARLMRWLNFDNLRSMTVFCTLYGFAGIHAFYHDGSSAELVCETDYQTQPITIFLGQDDAIEAVYLMPRDSKPTNGNSQQEPYPEPYLQVRTKKGGDFFFGPYIRSHGKTIASFGIDSGQVVTGIFVDANEITPFGALTIGVELRRFECKIKSKPQSNPRFPVRNRMRVEGIPRVLTEKTFLSTALVKEVQRLRVQQVGHRCVGLLIEAATLGPPRTLGQWDAARTDTVVYDISTDHRPLTNLVFYMSQRDDVVGRYVVNIVANANPQSERELWHGEIKKFEIWVPGCEIAWWFTPEYDRLERWRGGQCTFSSGVNYSNVISTYCEGY